MFNVATISESVCRHWLVIVLVTVLGAALGAWSSYNSNSDRQVAKSYTAEAVLYLNSYGYADDDREGGSYNYTLSEGYATSDARRAILGNEVAGEVRRLFADEEVTISSPRWRNSEKNADIDTRFIYIDASASTAEAALEAADKAADLAVGYISETLPVESVTVSERAYLKSGGDSQAADLGADELVSADDESSSSAVAVASRSISFKSVFVYAFVGLVLSIAVFAAYDILTRRLRSPRDVERLLDIPVLEAVRPTDSATRLASAVRAVMEQGGFAKLAVVGASAGDGALDVADGLSRALPGLEISAIALDADDDGITKIRENDAVLMVFSYAASSGQSVDDALWRVRVADIPVLGAAFRWRR